jgi:hypothetical protein
MSITGNVSNLIERYENSPSPSPPPSPSSEFPQLKSLRDLVTISSNILGNEMPPLCYNLNNITGSDINDKGSKIINDLLFKAYRKSINNNNYFDVAALTISLYKYERMFNWLGNITETDENGNPVKIKIDQRISGLDFDIAATSPYDFIKFTEKTEKGNNINYKLTTILPSTAQPLYDELMNKTERAPMSVEDFGKLYALLGLYLLRKKELSLTDPTVYVGFKQLQAESLQIRPYPPCDNS